MHNYEFGSTSSPRLGPHPDGDGHRSAFSLVLLIVSGVVAASLGLALVFWVLGLFFSVAALLLRVALVVAVAAFVWRRVTRGRSRKYDY